MWIDVLKAIVPPLARGVGGWLFKATEDGKIEKFEWQKLASTVLLQVMLGLGIYFSINYGSWGVDIDLLAASSGAALIDLLWWLGNKRKK